MWERSYGKRGVAPIRNNGLLQRGMASSCWGIPTYGETRLLWKHVLPPRYKIHTHIVLYSRFGQAPILTLAAVAPTRIHILRRNLLRGEAASRTCRSHIILHQPLTCARAQCRACLFSLACYEQAQPPETRLGAAQAHTL